MLVDKTLLKGFVKHDWSNGWGGPVQKYPAKGKFLQVDHSIRQNYDSERCFLAINSKRVDWEQSIKMKEGLVQKGIFQINGT